MICRAYLDIETTGLSPLYADLTVVGLCLESKARCDVIQWVGAKISRRKLISALTKAHILYTYNGARFDLPFIRATVGLDLKELITHRDLMYECWRRNLYGGLKAVEEKLAIPRKTQGVDGRMAVRLWYEYENYGNKQSLALLLAYNKEDVLNLTILRRKLKV